MLKPSFFLGLGLLAAAGLIDARPGHALCLTTSDSGANDCRTFDGATSTSTQTYTTTNLTSNTWFQLGFYSSDSLAYSITDIAWANQSAPGSNTPGTFTPLQDLLTTGAVGSPNYTISTYRSDGIGTPFYVRYTINGAVPNGTTITSSLLSNNNGVINSSGNLTAAGNNFVDVQRDSTATAVPAPLPILGAAAAFSQAKRLRKYSKTLSA